MKRNNRISPQICGKSEYTPGLVSVVIPNYNGIRYLKDCLDSIITQDYPDIEIIFVDNASSDDSVSFVSRTYPSVQIMCNTFNRGFSGAVNDGIKRSKGHYIFLLNTDTILSLGCISALVSEMKSNLDVGMCATKMIYPDGRINSTGISITRSGAARDTGTGEIDNGQYNISREVFCPCGGAALYLHDVLDSVNAFDEDFFLFMEDVDLGFRIRLSGWRCIYVPEAVVTHYHGGTAGVGSNISIYYGNRNIIWYVFKDFPVRFLISSFPWIIGRNVVVILYYLFKGKGSLIFRSKWDGLKGIPNMIKKRKNIHSSINSSEYLKWLSI